MGVNRKRLAIGLVLLVIAGLVFSVWNTVFRGALSPTEVKAMLRREFDGCLSGELQQAEEFWCEKLMADLDGEYVVSEIGLLKTLSPKIKYFFVEMQSDEKTLVTQGQVFDGKILSFHGVNEAALEDIQPNSNAWQ